MISKRKKNTREQSSPVINPVDASSELSEEQKNSILAQAAVQNKENAARAQRIEERGKRINAILEEHPCMRILVSGHFSGNQIVTATEIVEVVESK